MPLPLLAAGAIGLGALGQGIAGAIGSSKAAKTQARAADEARRLVDQYYQQARGYQEPYQAAGQVGLGQLQGTDYTVPYQAYSGPYQAQNAPQWQGFTAADMAADPGLAYRMQQGQQAIESSAAARGAGLSGPTLKALAKYGSELGSQEYGNAYQRALGTQAQQYQQFAGQQAFDYGKFIDEYNRRLQAQQQRYGQASQLAGIGQQAAGNLANLATGAGGALSGIIGQKAQAQAAGQMGTAQGIGNIFGGIGQLGSLGALYANPAFAAKAAPQLANLNPANYPYLQNKSLLNF